MRVLIIEDEDGKFVAIKNMLLEIRSDVEVSRAGSVNSAMRYFRNENYQLVILDMNLPTYEEDDEEDGGRNQSFGGWEILRYARRYKKIFPTVMVSQYSILGDDNEYLSLEEIDSRLYNEFPDVYLGVVFYDIFSDDWQFQLSEKISHILKVSE